MLDNYCYSCFSNSIRPFLDMGDQPMSLVSLKRDPQESKNLPTHKIYIYNCAECGHYFNAAFNPNNVDYSGAGCVMWNKGSLWQDHISHITELLNGLQVYGFVEIGAGDGRFLADLKDVEKLAIDPCEAVENCKYLGIDYKRKMFSPQDLPEGRRCVIMRHLLEHMTFPKDFVFDIRSKLTAGSYLAIEVPCIENAVRDSRIEDWTYEHPQHFTKDSLTKLVESCGFQVSYCEKHYGDEVLVLIAEACLRVKDRCSEYLEENIERTSEWLNQNNDDVAYWGGAGKSAMFLRKMKVPENALVVDSDERKWGCYVPGTGVKIQSPLILAMHPRPFIVATTSWRAEDIKKEVTACNIKHDSIYKFYQGMLTKV